jgi:hypothetical protein
MTPIDDRVHQTVTFGLWRGRDGVLEGFQQPSGENFVCSLCPKGGHFLKSRHYKASMLTRPRHGDDWKLYYVPYLMERTTPHYLLWGAHSDFSKCGSYFCHTLYNTILDVIIYNNKQWKKYYTCTNTSVYGSFYLVKYTTTNNAACCYRYNHHRYSAFLNFLQMFNNEGLLRNYTSLWNSYQVHISQATDPALGQLYSDNALHSI